MAGFAAMAGDEMAWKMICRCFTGSLARPAWLSSNDSICIRTWRGGLTETTWGAAIGTVARFRRKLEANCVLLFWAESPSWGLFRACQIHLNTIVRTTHCSMFSKRIKQNQENKRWFVAQHCTLHVVERLQRTNHPHVCVCACACVSCVKICWDFNHHSEVLRDWWAIFCAALPSPPRCHNVLEPIHSLPQSTPMILSIQTSSVFAEVMHALPWTNYCKQQWPNSERFKPKWKVSNDSLRGWLCNACMFYE